MVLNNRAKLIYGDWFRIATLEGGHGMQNDIDAHMD